MVTTLHGHIANVEAALCNNVTPFTVIESLEHIKAQVEAAVPGARLELVQNGSPSAQHSLLVDNEHAAAVARFLRDDPQLRLDYLSSVTGVDWLDTVIKKPVKT